MCPGDPVDNYSVDKNKNSVLPVLALVFAFLFPVAGFILSIIALAKKCEKKGLSVAALIISFIWTNIIISVVSVIIVVIGLSVGLGSMIVEDFKTYEQNEMNNVEGKKLTDYYYDSPIVSARYFHREDGVLVYDDIPEDQIDDLIDTLNALTIEQTRGLHVDYYYGMQRGVECTLEDGTYFTFDGERLEYYSGDEIPTGRFLYLDRPFDEAMEEFFEAHDWEQ